MLRNSQIFKHKNIEIKNGKTMTINIIKHRYCIYRILSAVNNNVCMCSKFITPHSITISFTFDIHVSTITITVLNQLKFYIINTVYYTFSKPRLSTLSVNPHNTKPGSTVRFFFISFPGSISAFMKSTRGTISES